MAEELKPCPCCGGEAVFVELDDGGMVAVCASRGCVASGVARYACGDEPRPLIAETWNARAAPAGHVVVSEGLVQGMAKFAREIICGAIDGGSFDGADIQESAERHGLIAKQVMSEPCRGPEEYCACAWSTSFPAECYRVTPELRALLSEQAGEEP
ncbi:Lar family restriction alleviation protein [Pseudomonas aeruginosa]